jgi:hypothetical protein
MAQVAWTSVTTSDLYTKAYSVALNPGDNTAWLEITTSASVRYSVGNTVTWTAGQFQVLAGSDPAVAVGQGAVAEALAPTGSNDLLIPSVTIYSTSSELNVAPRTLALYAKAGTGGAFVCSVYVTQRVGG